MALHGATWAYKDVENMVAAFIELMVKRGAKQVAIKQGEKGQIPQERDE